MRPEHPQQIHIPGLRKLWQEAFGDTDAFLDGFFSTAFSPERCVCIVQGERVLSAAYWLDAQLPEGKAAYIYAVATLKECRGRGLATKIMKALEEMLRRRDYVAAILVPAQQSLAEFYGGMGYGFFGGICECSALAKSPGIALRKINAAEYGALRKRYLPAGGVIQDGESLRFWKPMPICMQARISSWRHMGKKIRFLVWNCWEIGKKRPIFCILWG